MERVQKECMNQELQSVGGRWVFMKHHVPLKWHGYYIHELIETGSLQKTRLGPIDIPAWSQSQLSLRTLIL